MKHTLQELAEEVELCIKEGRATIENIRRRAGDDAVKNRERRQGIREDIYTLVKWVQRNSDLIRQIKQRQEAAE